MLQVVSCANYSLYQHMPRYIYHHYKYDYQWFHRGYYWCFGGLPTHIIINISFNAVIMVQAVDPTRTWNIKGQGPFIYLKCQ